jgi:hypothetical protein
MEITEVRVLLEFVKAHEPTLIVDNLSAQAWMDALDDMPAGFARTHIAHHYSRPDVPRLTVGALNAAWRARVKPDTDAERCEHYAFVGKCALCRVASRLVDA